MWAAPDATPRRLLLKFSGHLLFGAGLLLGTSLVLAPSRAVRASSAQPSPLQQVESQNLAAARAAGTYLLHHQRPDGTFQRRYEPRLDRALPGLDPRRQALTCFALFHLYGATGDPLFLAAGEQGLRPLLDHLQPGHPVQPGSVAEPQQVRYLHDLPGVATAGANAALLLALVEHHLHTDEEQWRATMQALAWFLLGLQQSNGELLDALEVEPDSPRHIALPGTGSAVLALARLGQIDDAGPWRLSARRAAVWQMAIHDLGRSVDDLPRDEWLVLALAELYLEEDWGRRFYIHARRITSGLLRERTQWPTWNPDCLSAARTARAAAAMAEIAAVGGDDPAPYQQATDELRARLLACQRPAGGVERRPEQGEITLPAVYHAILAWLEPSLTE